MLDFVRKLFDTSDFPARWYCGNWSPFDGWLHIVADIGIFGAYMAIPIMLSAWYFRGAKIPFPKLLLLFALFIISCGTTHALDALMFWWPAYRLGGTIRLFTAAVSWWTVLCMFAVFSKGLQVRSHEELETLLKDKTLAEYKLRAIRDTCLDAIIVADANGRIAHFNRSAERMFKRLESDVIGAPITLLMPEEYRERHTSGIRHYHQSHQSDIIGRTVEMQGQRADGMVFPIEISLNTFQVDGADFFAAIIRDISHRKRSEEQIRSNLKALQDQIHKRQLLEDEITILKTLQETQSSQIGATAQAIDKLNNVTLNLMQLMGPAHEHHEVSASRRVEDGPSAKTAGM